ncbi:MAG: DUF6446 family protein [Aestuariivita sp.]|nr:DUF6446 family protein [Aestuariivita sp.]
MSGKLVSGMLLFVAIIAGALLYYLQVYGYYRIVEDTKNIDVKLVSSLSQKPVGIDYSAFRAIDSNSSPIRYRACFETEINLEQLSDNYVAASRVIPRNAPNWFDCFDAEQIAAALASDSARVFLGQKNIHFGVDRVVAITSDGRGYIWHELNDCGRKSYDGTVIGETCPQRSK